MAKATRQGYALTRQEFLRGSLGVMATAALAGCDGLSTEPAGPAEDQRSTKEKEAPILAERVRDGDLPPVQERLPGSPAVVEPWERVGVYGGDWRTVIGGPADAYWLQRTIGYDNLVRWDRELAGIAPNLAEEFSANSDATEYTFTLRRGLKWSDGEPFTARDVVFASNDVLNNPEIYPAVIESPPIAEQLDEQTVKIVLAEPNGLFLQQQADPYMGRSLVSLPFHHMKQFHKTYNPDIDQLVEAEGAADWAQLFQNKGESFQASWQNGLPTLDAWMVTTLLGDSNRVVAERNPYYWKVDPDGSQLPYIDRVIYDVVQDPEVMLTKALNGEISYDSQFVTTPSNKPVLAQDRESGRYRFFDLQIDQMNSSVISLNLTHKDSIKREIFNNKDFRIGLSYAINRQEIIDTVFQQQGEPYQAAPRPEGPFYDEEFGKQYTDHDVDAANEHLDRAGYAERDDQGIRLGPDGEPISFAVELDAQVTDQIDSLELVRDYWRQVGIDMRLRTEDRSLFYERKEANDHDANVWTGGGGGIRAYGAILNARFYLPIMSESNFGIPWAAWYNSDGQAGEEPPEVAKQQMELYDNIGQTPDVEEHVALFREILTIAKEQFWAIGLNLPAAGYGIAKNSFRNVPEGMINLSVPFHVPAVYNPEQFFIEPEN